jgi:polyferredoxin
MSNFQWGLAFLIGGLAAMGALGFLGVSYQLGWLTWSRGFEDAAMLMILPMIGGPLFFWAIRPLWQRSRRS